MDNFENYVRDRGGEYEGYSSQETTVFFFDIFDKSLFPVLDRFAEIFLNPCFKKESIIRESEKLDNR